MSIPRNWRTRQQRYSLRAEVCNECGNTIFPPRDVCPFCAEQKQSWTNLSGRGEVYSYTTMYSAPTAFEEYTPYTVALVKLAEGPLITAQLTDVDTEQVSIGMPVEMVTRKLSQEGEEGQILYGYKFRPLLRPTA
jgi:scaffold protein (connect acetoacetyl-CoA thiolase and HMG-CoA synthase)